MRQVVVYLWCNPCLRKEVLVPATERRGITYGGLTTKLDEPWLCLAHAKELDDMLAPYLHTPDPRLLAEAAGIEDEPPALPEPPKAITTGGNSKPIDNAIYRNREMRAFADSHGYKYRRVGSPIEPHSWTYTYPVALKVAYAKWVEAGRP